MEIMKNIVLGIFTASILSASGHSSHAEELPASSPVVDRIYDNLLSERLKALDKAIEAGDAEATVLWSFLVKRASDRFVIVYGKDDFTQFRGYVASKLDEAAKAVPEKAKSEEIKKYRQSLSVTDKALSAG